MEWSYYLAMAGVVFVVCLVIFIIDNFSFRRNVLGLPVWRSILPDILLSIVVGLGWPVAAICLIGNGLVRLFRFLKKIFSKLPIPAVPATFSQDSID